MAAEYLDFLLAVGDYDKVIRISEEKLLVVHDLKELAVFLLTGVLARLWQGHYSMDAIAYASIIWYHPRLAEDSEVMQPIDVSSAKTVLLIFA